MSRLPCAFPHGLGTRDGTALVLGSSVACTDARAPRLIGGLIACQIRFLWCVEYHARPMREAGVAARQLELFEA